MFNASLVVAVLIVCCIVSITSILGLIRLSLRYHSELCSGDKEAWSAVGNIALTLGIFLVAGYQAKQEYDKNVLDLLKHRPALSVSSTIEKQAGKGMLVQFDMKNMGSATGKLKSNRILIGQSHVPSSEGSQNSTAVNVGWYPLHRTDSVFDFGLGDIPIHPNAYITEDYLQRSLLAKQNILIVIEADYCAIDDDRCWTMHDTFELYVDKKYGLNILSLEGIEHEGVDISTGTALFRNVIARTHPNFTSEYIEPPKDLSY